MQIAIKLDKEISCEYICQRIQKLVNKLNNSQQNVAGSVLVMDIRPISDGGNDHIPKIEFKNES